MTAGSLARCRIVGGHRPPLQRAQSTGLPWLDAAPSFFPVLAMVTFLALTFLLPFLARLPSTIISSPIFMVSRVHPEFRRALGPPISNPQFSVVPVSFLTLR